MKERAAKAADDYPGDRVPALTAAELQAIATSAASAIENERALRDRADTALQNLEAAWAGWAGLTAAQKDAALKLTVRVTISIARLVLRRLDSA